MRNIFYRYVDKKTLPTFSRPDFENVDYGDCKSNVVENGQHLYDDKGCFHVIRKSNELYHKKYGPIVNYIESLGDITVFFIQYLITKPNSKMTIHNDRDMIYQNSSWIYGDACSLNYSYGSSDSCLQFFKLKSAHYEDIERFRYLHSQKEVDNPYIYEGVRDEDTNLVAEAKHDTTHATLVNCGVFHRAVNYSNKTRYVVHFRLVKKSDNSIDIKFRDAKKLFKNHMVKI